MKKTAPTAITRRSFVHAFTAATALEMLSACRSIPEHSAKKAPPLAPHESIVDAHQHLWDLNHLELPWLQKADPKIAKSFLPAAYKEATEGLPVRTVYMEVAVAENQLEREAKWVEELITSGTSQTMAAILSGRPSDPQFGEYLSRCMDRKLLKGIRRILHDPETPRGTCLEADFIRGVRLLGERNLTFDVCIRPRELRDVVTLASECPDTQFILDHCGNADPKAFQTNPKAKPNHTALEWQRSMEAIAKKPNVACKISGIIEPMASGWDVEDLAPVVNHCLDLFGSDRVLFSSNWPVCLLGGSLRQWVDALAQITANRPANDRAKLWSENAARIYKLEA
jgi:L-fuconolactonase